MSTLKCLLFANLFYKHIQKGIAQLSYAFSSQIYCGFKLFIKWKFSADFVYTCTNIICVVHFLNAKTSCSNRRSTNSDTACYEWTAWLVWNSIFINSYINLVESMLKFLASDFSITKVKEHNMVVCTARNKVKTSSGLRASPKQTALAAIMCISGPP